MEANQEERKRRVSTIIYLKRLFNIQQMDLDYTFTQMIQLCTSPTRV